jgi:hypothetical protein
MDYGKLLSRAWDIIWKYKFLIILGLLVALSGGLGSGTSSGTNIRFEGDVQGPGFIPPQPETFPDPGRLAEPAIPFWLGLLLVGLALIVATVLWVISILARGGLIAGAAAADRGERTSFSQAWSVGWRRGWTLLGIGLIPAIPGLIILLLAGVGFLAYTTTATTNVGVPAMGPISFILVALACIALPLALVLELLRTFANRACMLEGLGVLDAYRRGIQVLFDNLGSALVLFLFQVAVTIVMFILLIVPGAILALCCLFWPVLLLIQGAITAYFSTMWTLAWRRWTDVVPAAGEPLAV